MITPKCDKCGEELNELGGLAFSPPNDNDVIKYHICVKCWTRLLDWLNKSWL